MVTYVMPMQLVHTEIKKWDNCPGFRMLAEEWIQYRPEMGDSVYITWNVLVIERSKILWPKFWEKRWVRTFPKL